MKQSNLNIEAQNFIMNAWVTIPKVSAEGLCQAFPLIVNAWLSITGLSKFMPNQIDIANSTPCTNSFHNIAMFFRNLAYSM